MSYVNRPPRGQQRDKIYREALRLELADMSEGPACGRSGGEGRQAG